MDSQNGYGRYAGEEIQQRDEVRGVYLSSSEDDDDTTEEKENKPIPFGCYINEGEIHQKDELGGEYLYSSEYDKERKDEKGNEPTEFREEVGGEYLYSDEEARDKTGNESPNPRTTKSGRKKRPVSRQDSDLYDMAVIEENPYDAISLDKNDATWKPNARSRDMEKKRQTKENEWHSVAINWTKDCSVNCNKRTIVISSLCAIFLIGVVAISVAVVYSSKTTGILSNCCFRKLISTYNK